MHPVLRNVLLVLAAIALGSILNGIIIVISGSIISYPEGVSSMNPESIIANIDKFEPQHFIFPFLAHALGTLLGAFIVAKWVTTKPFIFALGIGIWFTLMGILNSVDIGSPTYFFVIDVALAYVPMAWLGYKLSGRKENEVESTLV